MLLGSLDRYPAYSIDGYTHAYIEAALPKFVGEYICTCRHYPVRTPDSSPPIS